MAVADINQDGQPDILTAPGGGIYTRVRTFDGRTGTPLLFGQSNGLVAYSPNYLKGASVAAGDVDGDGDAEIIVSSDKGPRPVKIFDRDGTLLSSFFPYGSAFKGDVRIAVGNTAGTAAGEIVTVKANGQPEHRRASTGRRVFEQFAVSGNLAVGDVTGDAQADIRVGSNVGQPGRVRILRRPRRPVHPAPYEEASKVGSASAPWSLAASGRCSPARARAALATCGSSTASPPRCWTASSPTSRTTRAGCSWQAGR